MPEGDSVHRTAAALHSGLAGQQLLRSDFRVPALATVDLSGRTVEEAVSRGKHLLIRIGPDPRTGARALTLHSHLMMEGRWELEDLSPPAAAGTGPRGRTAAGSGSTGRRPGTPEERSRRRTRPQHTIRAVLETEGTRATASSVQQLVIVAREQEDRLVGHLGPDLLAPDWSEQHLQEAVRRLHEGPQQPIAAALMDQSKLAGIGSIYRCELLFRHHLAPETAVAEVPDLAAVVEDAHELLLRNRERGPRVTTGDPRPGRQLWVYGRERRPCWRCGTAIVKRTWDDAAGQRDPRTGLQAPARERPFYFCPRCQR